MFFFLRASLFFFLFVSFTLFGETSVLVSIAPYKTLVSMIGGTTVDVKVVVPPGASAHTYEPTPKQFLSLIHADAWFMMGESFEAKIKKSLKSHKPSMLFVDLRETIDPIVSNECFCCAHGVEGNVDPHFWLSPRSVKTQVPLIVETLSTLLPENRAMYEQNGKILIEKLDQLDQDLKKIFQGKKRKTIVVSHPAYTYLVRDYDLNQLSVEIAGKDPTTKQAIELVKKAKEEKVKTVFIQPQHNVKGAVRVAKELSASIIELDPYQQDYFENMRFIGQNFSEN